MELGTPNLEGSDKQPARLTHVNAGPLQLGLSRLGSGPAWELGPSLTGVRTVLPGPWTGGREPPRRPPVIRLPFHYSVHSAVCLEEPHFPGSPERAQPVREVLQDLPQSGAIPRPGHRGVF